MQNPKLAFVFPGQGSQKIGMLAELAEAYPLVEQTFAEASGVLGYDLWKLAQQGTQEEINLTETTQPLLLTSSVAIWRIWQHLQGARPVAVAGHSLGEWSALVCAGVVEFSDAVNLVRLRGAYMQAAVPAGEGAMAAILGLDDAQLAACCEQASQGEEVAAVNFNAPGQVVIAGVSAAVERAIALCKDAGAKRAMPLPVSAPFHTLLMKPAADKLTRDIGEVAFSAPQIPLVHNVHAQTEGDPEAIKTLMIEQIYSPVRWVDCVRALQAQGAELAVECGPGKVLCGLSKRIDKTLQMRASDNVADLQSAVADAKPQS
jgi:[acyl-carrier-protein] S-malonyltransferase